jgi:hypothetical protein
MDLTNQLNFGTAVNDGPINLVILIISLVCIAVPVFMAVRSAIRRWRGPHQDASGTDRVFSHKQIIIDLIFQAVVLAPVIAGFIQLFRYYSSYGVNVYEPCGGLLLPFVIFWNVFLIAILYIQVDFVWLEKKEHKTAVAVFDIVLFCYVIIWYFGTAMFSVSCV